METQRLPSLCAAVIKDGKTQFEECFGFSNIEKKIAATPDTMYAIASMTKPLTATGLMTLVERRLVDLDRPANDYLGGAKLVAYVGSASGATVRRLLHCTSGLPEHLNIFYANEKWKRPPVEQSIRRYGILVSAPGEVYTYSNFSYAVLEHIIERVTGQEYAVFMKTQVFEPLGMTRTAVLTQSPLDDSVAVKYDGKRQPLALSDYDHRGASAAYASLRDVVKLARFVSKSPVRGQKRILRDKTIDMMLNSTDASVPANHLRLGWAVLDHEGLTLIHASGGMPGAAARLGVVPRQRLISVLLTNAYTEKLWDIEKAVFAAYLSGYAEKASIPKLEPATQPPAFAPPPLLTGVWTGTVKTHEGDSRVRVSIASSGAVRFELDDRVLSVIRIPPGIVDWRLTFEDGVLKIPLGGGLKNSDTVRSPHILYAVLKLRENRLTGHLLAAAVDMKFTLPYWIELRKAHT